MNFFFYLYNYLWYLLKSTNAHGVHSPFIFNLLTNVIYNKAAYYGYKNIENLRAELVLSDHKIKITDLGAGSITQKSNFRKVKKIAQQSAKSANYGQLLFRLVNHFQPGTILELGTSLGISTAYLASANSKANIISIEGCPEIAKIASQNFEKLELKNIEQVVGNFDNVLPVILNKQKRLDFVFFDGNHHKEPTLNYFRQCLQNAHEGSVFVFDDINWSSEMREAWLEIKNNNQVTVTIDLFFIGIIFFRKEQAKQHFVIRY